MKLALEELRDAVHAVLRGWHTGEVDPEPWQGMLVVRQRLAAHPAPGLELAVREVLAEGLETLETEQGGHLAQILRLRFLDGLTARAAANRLNLTENVVYKQQRTALDDLATILAGAEEEAGAARLARVVERLEIQAPARLFGVDDKLAELAGALTGDGSPWLVALTGIGGIGKTSLADRAVRRLAPGPLFADIAWVSARQERFTLWSGLEEGADDTPALTFAGLVDAVAEQLGFRDLASLPWAQKKAALRARLGARAYLVVVDNLETAADYRALIPDLQALVNPSRFLLTCRPSLHDHPGVHNVSMAELSAGDSLALIRHEAGERGLAGVAGAPEERLRQVYDVTGGNPLALKLLVGQMHTLSLSTVVDDLREARGQTVEELYRFIYWRSWNLLDDRARHVLAIMPLVAERGGGLEQITALSTLARDDAVAGLKQLVTLSLVDVHGTLEARRYGIHRLTETFLLREVLKWQA